MGEPIIRKDLLSSSGLRVPEDLIYLPVDPDRLIRGDDSPNIKVIGEGYADSPVKGLSYTISVLARRIFRPMYEGRSILPTFVYGISGIGKTTIILYFIKLLRSKYFNVMVDNGVVPIYVPIAPRDTEKSIFGKIYSELAKEFSDEFTGIFKRFRKELIYPFDFGFIDKISRFIQDKGLKLYIFFDDAHNLMSVSYGYNNFIFHFVRLRESMSDGDVIPIFITNVSPTVWKLPFETMRRMRSSITLPDFTDSDVYHILKARVDAAFPESVLDFDNTSAFVIATKNTVESYIDSLSLSDIPSEGTLSSTGANVLRYSMGALTGLAEMYESSGRKISVKDIDAKVMSTAMDTLISYINFSLNQTQIYLLKRIVEIIGSRAKGSAKLGIDVEMSISNINDKSNLMSSFIQSAIEKKLSKNTNSSRKLYYKTLAALEKKGLVSVDRFGHRINSITLNVGYKIDCMSLVKSLRDSLRMKHDSIIYDLGG